MMDNRIELIRQILQEHSLGAILLWRPDELVLSLGYHPYWGISFGVFTATDTLLYIPENEPNPYLKDDDVVVKCFQMGMRDKKPWDALFTQISSDLAQIGLSRKKLGFIKSVGGTALTSLAAEQPALPDDLIQRLMLLCAGWHPDSESAIKSLYDIKLQSDIDALRLTQQVAAKGVSTFYESLDKGVSEIEIQCAVESTIACQTEKDGVRFARGWVQIQSGFNSSLGGKYNTTTAKKLENGDLVLMELGVCVNGYWADLSRTGYVGAIPRGVQEQYDMVEKAQQEAIRCIRAGVEASRVYNAAADVLAQNGYLDYFPHALGHGVGFRYHEFSPTLTHYNDLQLKTGMVLTIEPGIYGEKIGGIRVEDNVLVTETGCEVLSCARKGMKGELI